MEESCVPQSCITFHSVIQPTPLTTPVAALQVPLSLCFLIYLKSHIREITFPTLSNMGDREVPVHLICAQTKHEVWVFKKYSYRTSLGILTIWIWNMGVGINMHFSRASRASSGQSVQAPEGFGWQFRCRVLAVWKRTAKWQTQRRTSYRVPAAAGEQLELDENISSCTQGWSSQGSCHKHFHHSSWSKTPTPVFLHPSGSASPQNTLTKNGILAQKTEGSQS